MNIIYLDEVDSTNNYLKRLAGELPDKTAVCAENQTAGKGRSGHKWESGAGLLAVSVLFKDPVEVESFTARVGLGVAEAIEKTLSRGVFAGIKWPNDVIIENHKVCGILCESARSGDSPCVVCGIGVNIGQDEEFFVKRGIPHGGSIFTLTGELPEKRILLENVCECVVKRCERPFADCYDEYKRRVLNIGREVRIIRGESETLAKAIDIAKNGFLVCRGESGVFEVHSGEVSVRGREGYL